MPSFSAPKETKVSIAGQGGIALLCLNGNENDAFWAEGSPEELSQLAKVLEFSMKDEETAAKIRALPMEKRPSLAVLNGTNCRGLCEHNPPRVCIAGYIGTGLQAAATFVHEMHHHFQNLDDPRYDACLSEFSLARETQARRMCEATANAAETAFMYRMRDKDAYMYGAIKKDRPELAAYHAQMELSSDSDAALNACLKAYASKTPTALFYEKWYLKQKLAAYSERLDKAEKTAPHYSPDFYAMKIRKLNKDAVSPAKNMDASKAFAHYACGLFKTRQGLENGQKLAQSEEFAYITANTAAFLSRLCDASKAAGLTEEASKIENLTVRTVKGLTTLGNLRAEQAPVAAKENNATPDNARPPSLKAQSVAAVLTRKTR